MAIYLTIKRSSLTGGKKPFGGKQPKFVEGQHMRDSHGRFSSKPGGKSPKPQEIQSDSTKLPDTGRPRKGGQIGWDSDDPIGTVVRAHLNTAIEKAYTDYEKDYFTLEDGLSKARNRMMTSEVGTDAHELARIDMGKAEEAIINRSADTEEVSGHPY